MTVYNLGDHTITAALTDYVITDGVSVAGVAQALIDQLDGMSSVSLECRFVYGSSGTSVAVTVQTAFGGSNWIDIARFEFTTANGAKIANVVGTGAVAIASIAALSSETVGPGILGDRLRAKVTSLGTYAGNTSVSVRASVR
ncbi:MAG: hypothetical protein AB7I42_24915 [Bradyrhizobium sp.]|uniref:hypothetical protein n=1 Tax=Bradyrhizobium sp. TaxID=376 RepID=UPI003D0A7C68